MTGWILYHPKRTRSAFGSIVVYHDRIEGNQDPYVWQSPFLHTYCHMYQMRPEPEMGDIILWVSSGQDRKYPHFVELLCDLVFVVKEKVYWRDANNIKRSDSMVDSPEAYADHYVWGNVGHHYKHRKRFTLRADENESFQAQTREQKLIDIVPFLECRGILIAAIRKGLYRNPIVSGPMRIDYADAEAVRRELRRNADIELRGKHLESIRNNHPAKLMSPPPSRIQNEDSMTRKNCC